MVVLGLLLSLAIGLSLGLLGGGGSLLTLPVLHYVFNVSAHEAVAMSLVVVAVTSLVALAMHARAGSVRWATGITFGAASMAAAFGGARIGSTLPDSIVLAAFAITMLIAGTAMVLRRAPEPLGTTGSSITLRATMIGLGVGLLTGVLGAGGGFIVVPTLMIGCGLALREAVATSVLVIAMNSLAALAAHATETTLDMPLVATVTSVAAVGSLLGIVLGYRLSTKHLQRGFGWFVITIGLVMLVRG
ncbi:MAG TPA: sulfite exporter TauE/SafE family protein [Kofleriaceae bacterium]|nr:sulfite exporter TauE/SafE family protein [Kofleriaceae bacterium]